MPYPDKFYPVVDSIAWVARLTKLGVGTIQLRAKNLDDGGALQLVSDVTQHADPDARVRAWLGESAEAA